MQGPATFAEASDLGKVKYVTTTVIAWVAEQNLRRIQGMVENGNCKGEKVEVIELTLGKKKQKEDANFFAYLVTGCFIELLNSAKEQDNDKSRLKEDTQY